MTIIEVNLHDGVTGRNSLAGMNNTTFSATAGAILVSDLKDTAGALTGLSLVNTEPATEDTGSSSQATAGSDGFPAELFQAQHYGNHTYTITGLAAGDTWEFRGHGHHGGGDVTTFTINGTAGNYTDSGTTTPGAPVVITGTMASAGDLTIAVSLSSGSYARHTGFRLTINSTKPGLPSDIIQFEGAAQANLTGLQVFMTAGTEFWGSVIYDTTTATTDADGRYAAITPTSGAVGDSVLLYFLTADGKGVVVPKTLEDIS